MLFDLDALEFVDLSPSDHYERPEVMVKQINDALLSTEKSRVMQFAYDDKSYSHFSGQKSKKK